MTAFRRERDPAVALVAALVGRTVVEATCDGEGAGDARLLLEDGRIILIDKDSAAIPNRWRSANNSAAHPGRLRVLIRGRELWPFDQD